MRTWSLAAGLCMVFVLSGCVSEESPAGPDPDDEAEHGRSISPERPVPGLATRNVTAGLFNASALSPENVMSQSGCQSFYSSHRVTMDYARPLLPSGLEPFRGDAGTSLFTMKAWDCSGSTVDNATISSGGVVLYYLAVTPDAPYASDDVVFYWYPLQISAGTDDLAAAFASWGFTVVDRQEVAITWNQGFDPWVVSVAADGEASVDGHITVPSFATDEVSFTVRYFAAADGIVTGGVDIVVHPGSRGGMGPTALRFGGDEVPAPAMVGVSSFQGWDTAEVSYTWTPITFSG